MTGTGSLSSQATVTVPFDADELDRLMETHGLDALLVTSKHNVQYLLGGHRFFWFDYMDAVGVSRYLPVFIYIKGAPELAYYVANVLEAEQLDNQPVWVTEMETTSWGVADALSSALAALRRRRSGDLRIGIETDFIPFSALGVLREDPRLDIADCSFVLERLRARKSPGERHLVTEASKRTVASILDAFAAIEAGMTKRDAVDILRRAEVARGLTFEYCLINVGTDLNRAANDSRIRAGDLICLDSGGNYQGYIGDLARMGLVGEPDDELIEALAWVDSVQQAARSVIAPGVIARDIYASAERALATSSHRKSTAFVAHGMGLVSHEAPRITNSGPIPYPDEDRALPLQAGYVLSIETTLKHRRGFIKLEDTLLVVEDGHEAVGDDGRGWNVCGNRGDVSAKG